MRTTVNIEDHLLRAARHEALTSGRSLGAVLDDALKVFFSTVSAGNQEVSLPTDGGSGLRPGVDLEDKEALAELLEGQAADAPA